MQTQCQHNANVVCVERKQNGNFSLTATVVGVANHTLEQEELKYMTGSRRSYASVLTADKGKDLCRPQQRNRRVVEGPLRNSRRESDHEETMGFQAGGMLVTYRHKLNLIIVCQYLICIVQRTGYIFSVNCVYSPLTISKSI